VNKTFTEAWVLAVILPGDPSQSSIISRHDSPSILVTRCTFVKNIMLIVVILNYLFHTTTIKNTWPCFVILR
jgi:hypothetical protein